jgi:hypothetical protein
MFIPKRFTPLEEFPPKNTSEFGTPEMPVCVGCALTKLFGAFEKLIDGGLPRVTNADPSNQFSTVF